MAEMTFWDHLDELRKVLFRVIGIWFVLAIGYFIAMPYLFDHVILAPCHNDFIFYDLLRYIGQKFDLTDDFFTQDFHVKLVNINLAAPFFIHLSTAFMLSVVTAIPYLFFEIWRFISPALYPNERKGVRKALTIGTFMFFIGVLLGYFMVYPLTLRFLSTFQLSSEVENILSLNSYIDNFMMLILCMGLAFTMAASVTLSGCGTGKKDSGKTEIELVQYKPEAVKAFEKLEEKFFLAEISSSRCCCHRDSRCYNHSYGRSLYVECGSYSSLSVV